MIKPIYYLCLIPAILFSAPLQGQTVAIVVDPLTLQKARTEINDYMAAINRDGKKTLLIEDVWQHPDSIKQALKTLYKTDKNLEGAVLIGDIPIAILSDAQHLATLVSSVANRMDPNG